jgi:ATP synthase protein I
LAGPAAQLLHYRGLVRSTLIEPGRVGAYLALFSEIGLLLLVTTLAGVLVGYWADTQLKTLPVFVIIGLFAGLGLGAIAVRRLINRFLASFDD